MSRPKKVAIQEFEIEQEYVENTEINSELISDLEQQGN